jgi:hypothetical protein
MSASLHKYPALPVPEIRLGSQFTNFRGIAGFIGGLALLLCIAGFWRSPKEFYQSYLFAYLYWVGFSVGGLGILLLNNVVGGRWGVTTRSFLLAAARTLPAMLLLFIPFFFGMRHIWPWADPSKVSTDAFLWHKRHYMNIPFFWIRVAFYFAIFLFFTFRMRSMADQQDATGDPVWASRMRRFSAPGLLVFVFVATFAYIDWVLSTDNQFYSTVYGAMLLIGNILQTFALVITVLILASKNGRFGGRVNSNLLHDLGNLMFAFTIFWTYLSVSQLIIIWPADLPQEIAWYLDRVRGSWKVIAATVSLIMFAIPFLALLSQARKQTPHRLIRVAVWLMIAKAIDLFWIIEPTYRKTGLTLYWTDFAAFVGVGGVWLYLYLGYLQSRPLLPLHDPRIMPAIPEVAA